MANRLLTRLAKLAKKRTPAQIIVVWGDEELPEAGPDVTVITLCWDDLLTE